MKKLFILALFFVPVLIYSQNTDIRINGYALYVADDGFESFNSNTSFFDGTIKGGLLWGVGLEMLPHRDYGVELMYYRQDTEVPVNYYRLVNTSRTLDASVNYIMLGGVRYMSPNPKVQGYGGLMLGTVIYDNKEPLPDEPNTVTKFAWGFRLGANIWGTEKIGIKIQTQLISAVQALGGSFYVGTGGSGAGVSGYSTIYQFGIGGGLTFRMGSN